MYLASLQIQSKYKAPNTEQIQSKYSVYTMFSASPPNTVNTYIQCRFAISRGAGEDGRTSKSVDCFFSRVNDVLVASERAEHIS